MNRAAFGWPITRLGEIISHRKEFIEIDDTEKYKRCRVQLHAKGIVLRDEVEGITIKTKKQQVCRAGELLVAEIDAKVGGFGIVPTELDRAIVSSHYFLYTLNPVKVDSAFINYFVKTPFFREQVKAQGSTNYAAIRPNQVLDYEIPLPSLSEQSRIVAKIDRLAADIEEARGLRKKCYKISNLLIDAELEAIFAAHRKVELWKKCPLLDVADINPRRPILDLKSDDIVSFVPMAAVDADKGKITAPQNRPLGEVSKGYTYFQEGDVLFARITPCMQNGKSAIGENLTSGIGFGTTEFHVLRPSEKIDAKFLHRIVRSVRFRRDAEQHFKGTAGQQRVPVGFLRKKTITVPPVDEQRRLVEYLDGLQAKTDELKTLQAKTSAELDAMLPSILDRVFKGEF